jgi:hypothetical protein
VGKVSETGDGKVLLVTLGTVKNLFGFFDRWQDVWTAAFVSLWNESEPVRLYQVGQDADSVLTYAPERSTQHNKHLSLSDRERTSRGLTDTEVYLLVRLVGLERLGNTCTRRFGGQLWMTPMVRAS